MWKVDFPVHCFASPTTSNHFSGKLSSIQQYITFGNGFFLNCTLCAASTSVAKLLAVNFWARQHLFHGHKISTRPPLAVRPMDRTAALRMVPSHAPAPLSKKFNICEEKIQSFWFHKIQRNWTICKLSSLQ